jgi:hypothetical protein
MNPETIMIDDVLYVRADSVETKSAVVDGLSYCVVRCHDAGVHSGFVKERKSREVVLLKSRRLWRWWGKTLSGLAIEGTTAPEKCKFADELAEITVLDACEVIPCTEIAMKSLRGVAKWTND